jgi:aminoglycoside/choline kinase family phosphotransferase
VTPAAFLAGAGFAAAHRTPLAQDAGHRRYTRLTGGPRPALLLDASAAPRVGLDPAEDTARFAALARHLRAHGIAAPEVLAEAPAAGLLLVEDLGPRNAAEALDAGADPTPLYEAAATTLAALQRVPPPSLLPAWDAPRMAEAAAATFCEWWWPAAMGATMPPALRGECVGAIAAMLAPFAAAGVVHRDFFPANLIPRAGAAPGLIDFQDAGLGHPAYDLVSLIEDARRDVAPELAEAAFAAYAQAAALRDVPGFRAAMAAVAAQRHLRVAALWVRLDRRDGKPGYLRHGPRCWALLERALAHEAAAPLARFLDREVPRKLRANPPQADR